MTIKVNERVFGAVKLMLKSGAKYREVAEYMEISEATVKRISASESFAEYKNIMVAMAVSAKARKGKQAEKPAPEPEPIPEQAPEPPVIADLKMPGGTMSAAYQFNRMIEMVKKQNEILTLMSNKLTYLVEQLT